MNDTVKILLIVGFLLVILWNLGAALYYMMVDKGTTKAGGRRPSRLRAGAWDPSAAVSPGCRAA